MLEVIRTRLLGELREGRFRLGNQVPQKELAAFVYAPRNVRLDQPALVVLHGVTRAASSYLTSWMPMAEKLGLLLIVPHFSDKHWPGARSYNLGNMRTRAQAWLPRDQWAFTVLDQLCEEVSRSIGHRNGKYCFYGHSAGAQFLHRYLFFTGGRRVCSAVIANAGWYTVPRPADNMPYGIANAPIAREDLQDAFATALTVLLGKDDIDTDDPELRRTTGALRQGPHRLARGRYFFQQSQRAAEELALPFHWKLAEVDRCGHNDRDVSKAAIKHLMMHNETSLARLKRTA